MAPALAIADTIPEGLPFAAELIEAMRRGLAAGVPAEQVLADAVAAYPALEQAAPVSVLAEWLNIKEGSVYVARTRKRDDGTPVWPEPDAKVGKTSLWKFGTAALGRATAPGRGWRHQNEAAK